MTSFENVSIDDIRKFAAKYTLYGAPIKGRSKIDLIDKLKSAGVDINLLLSSSSTNFIAPKKQSILSQSFSQSQEQYNRKKTYIEQAEEMKRNGSTQIKIRHDFESSKITTKLQRQVRFQELQDKIGKYIPTTKCEGDQSIAIQWLEYLIQKHGFKSCLIGSYLGDNVNRFHGIILRWNRLEGFKAYLPDDFADQIQYCRHPILFIPLAIHMTGKNAHANLLIIDKIHNTYERFDPNGYSGRDHFKLLNEWLAKDFRNHLPQNSTSRYYKYLSDEDACPIIGPQPKGGLNPNCSEDQGYCVIFSIMFAHLRLLLPDASRTEIYDLWMNSMSGSDLLNMILRYQTWMEETISVINELHAVDV